MGIVLISILYPLLYMFSVSFSSAQYIAQGQVTFFPKGFTLDSYYAIMETPRIPKAYLNSVIYTVVGVTFNVIFTVVTAYPLSRKNMVFRNPILVMIIITMFFNGGMIPNFLLVSNLRMIDTIWALFVPNLIWTFELLIMKNFFEGIPKDMHESAKIDGASEFTILARIMVPLSFAPIATLVLFFTMGHWNSYFIPSIYLNDMNKYPLQVVLKNMLLDDMATQYSNVQRYAHLASEGLKNATIFLSLVPMMVIYPFLQKYFVKGVMVGAVKG